MFVFPLTQPKHNADLDASNSTYWMAGLSADAARFFKFLLILVLFSLAMALYNFLLACTFSNGGIAILLSALFNLFTMTFAGFCKFVPLSKRPADLPCLLQLFTWTPSLLSFAGCSGSAH